MSDRVIEVVVSPKGEVSVQTRGYAGAECLQVSRFVEAALGQALSDTLTAEYYQQSAHADQQVRQ